MCEDSVFFENPSYLNAIIGNTHDGAIVYSFSKMVDCLVEEEDMDEMEAVDFIEYNTIRSLPYCSGLTDSELTPVIVYDLEEDIDLQNEIEKRRAMGL